MLTIQCFLWEYFSFSFEGTSPYPNLKCILVAVVILKSFVIPLFNIFQFTWVYLAWPELITIHHYRFSCGVLVTNYNTLIYKMTQKHYQESQTNSETTSIFDCWLQLLPSTFVKYQFLRFFYGNLLLKNFD